MATKKNTAIKYGDKEYNYYRITRTVGHKWENGKKVPIKKQFTGTSKGNAEKKYEAWREAQKNKNKAIIDSSKTLGELLEYYSDNILAVNSKYAPTTRDLYISAYKKHIAPYKPLCDKTAAHVQAADVQLCYNSIDTGPAGMATINKFMAGFFKWACANHFCSNIMDAVIIPEKHSNKPTATSDDIVIRSDEEVEMILKCSAGTRFYALFVVALYTGMRISEILGLRYSDIDDNVIHVRQQYTRGIFKLPKGDKTRDLPMHPMVANALNTMSNTATTELVFPSACGTPQDYHNLMKSIDRFYKKYGIEHKKFHAYRATFCTNLCRAGVPLQVASKLMGHSSVEVTAKFYALVENKEKENAILKLKSF